MRTKDTIKETILDLLERHPADDITVKMVCIVLMQKGISAGATGIMILVTVMA